VRARVGTTGAVLLALVLAACGGSSSDQPLGGTGSSASRSGTQSASQGASAGGTERATPLASAGGSSSPSGTAAVRTLTVRVAHGKVSPPPSQIVVRKGTVVALTVTSDERDEVHVHGYDLEKELQPGVPGTLRFAADQVGRVEVETHESGLVLFELITR